MTCLTPAPIAYGNFPTNTQPRAARLAWHVQEPVLASNPLERLAQLVISNDRLMDDLATSRASIVAARAYLDRPGCHAPFGTAHLERCRSRHSGILAQLRANRIETLHLLGDSGSAD